VTHFHQYQQIVKLTQQPGTRPLEYDKVSVTPSLPIHPTC